MGPMTPQAPEVNPLVELRDDIVRLEERVVASADALERDVNRFAESFAAYVAATRARRRQASISKLVRCIVVSTAALITVQSGAGAAALYVLVVCLAMSTRPRAF